LKKGRKNKIIKKEEIMAIKRIVAEIRFIS